MKKIIIALITFFYLTVISAQQVCHTESEIPSTTPLSNFIDNNDGTVFDLTSRLVWQKCQLGFSGINCEISASPNTFTWQEALQEAQASSFAGYDDWRLPNVKELRTLVEQRCQSPAINSQLFLSSTSTDFWTSSPYKFNANNSWSINFDSGFNFAYPRTNFLHVRLVRSR